MPELTVAEKALIVAALKVVSPTGPMSPTWTLAGKLADAGWPEDHAVEDDCWQSVIAEVRQFADD